MYVLETVMAVKRKEDKLPNRGTPINIKFDRLLQDYQRLLLINYYKIPHKLAIQTHLMGVSGESLVVLVTLLLFLKPLKKLLT